MASTYVTVAGAGLMDGTSWANAYASASFEAAIEAAAANTCVYIDQGTYTVSADTTIAFANTGVMVIATNDTANAVPTVLGAATLDGSGTAGVDLNIKGTGLWYGITFKSGGSSTEGKITLNDGVLLSCRFYSCSFVIPNTNGSSKVYLAAVGSGGRVEIITRNCTFTFGTSDSQGINNYCVWRSYGDTLSSARSASLFGTYGAGAEFHLTGFDLSNASGTIFVALSDVTLTARLYGCKLHASATVWNPTTISAGDLLMIDCDSGDNHYKFAHYSPLGSTVMSTTVYITADGATYDGTNRYSWLVSSTSRACYALPYISPWIPVYRGTTGNVTPWLECLRKANATTYTDAEVWADWDVKVTSGFPLTTISSDRDAVFNPTGTAQAASSLGAGDWTGEDVTNNAFFKIGPASAIDIKEIGIVMMRVAIGKASVTDLYVDPKVRA